MNYVKKMCVLRQVKQGFSGDGKTLSGLVKLEQYGKNLAVEVSIINFAPLSAGEYYCLLCDLKGVCEMLPLRSKSLFNIITDLDVSDGYCAVICFVKNEITPIAYGVNGKSTYNWRNILNTLSFAEPFNALTSMQEEKSPDVAVSAAAENSSPAPVKAENPCTTSETTEKIPLQQPVIYDDELVSKENYYDTQELENESHPNTKNCDYAPPESGNQKQTEQEQANSSKDEYAKSVLDKTTPNTEYYLTIQGELDELFQKYPRDTTLNEAIAHSEWVRVKGDETQPLCLVGVVYEELKPKYICYALPTDNKTAPPQEIKDACVFVPKSPYDTEKGFFVIFQNATTGVTIANPQ